MVVGFDIKQECQLQMREGLKPSHWKNKTITDEQLHMIMFADEDVEYKELNYREHLAPLLANRIAKVVEEQTYTETEFIDIVDTKVKDDEHKKKVKTCPSCVKTIKSDQIKTKRMCCYKEERVTAKVKGDDVEFVKQKHPTPMKGQTTSAPVVESFVLTPVMVNPNSYDAVISVLESVGKQIGMKKYGAGNKEFVFIYCDGVPYTLIVRICRSTFRCNKCAKLFTTQASCRKHAHDDCTYTLEFDWVLLMPGAGHIEMNMLRALVEILWPVFWKEMLKLFKGTGPG